MAASPIPLLEHPRLRRWVDEIVALCQPERIHLCDGSNEERKALSELLVEKGTFHPLRADLFPNSFLARSHPEDVARVEGQTYICSLSPGESGPTNNWEDPEKMEATLRTLFSGCMRGRTLYVIPFCMGPYGSPLSRIGVEITDSPYVVVNMHIMTRVGTKVLDLLGKEGEFVPCLHSVGVPLSPGEQDLPWPCAPEKRHIVHFPQKRSIWSFGSGYGGNALLGKKCFALRIASAIAKEEGWLAEHMLVVGITNPRGKKRYFAAAFPSACGKTNLAMLLPTLPGWKVETVGDDIAWMKWDTGGVLRAINPEFGFFGVAPGTSVESNPHAMVSLHANSIFTNVALTDEGGVWWEGMTPTPPSHLIDWLGRDWAPGHGEKAAHPNARFTAPASQCPVIDPAWEDPQGVPISGILFGGRRADTIPLVYEAYDWEHGVLIGAALSSETTAAAVGEVGKVRHDPFAMLPFCGYHMGDYFSHWLSMEKPGRVLPKIFSVNWFQKGEEGRYLWPGFGENIRVLEWIFSRCEGEIDAVDTPIGRIPTPSGIDCSQLTLSESDLASLFSIDRELWQKEYLALLEYFALFGDRLPASLRDRAKHFLGEVSKK